nr:tol-Pal system protein TolA-like [Aegilops tauschii subsp. strangulata]
MPAKEEEIRGREEALALEAVERSLELERLETREHQVAQAEDAVGAREAKAQEEVDRRVAEVRANLEGRHDLKLKLAETEAVGRAAALRPRLAEVERREEATAAALVTAQEELASAHAELLTLQKRVADAESVARQSREEVLQRRMLERVHAPMLQDLRNRANTALGHICDENAPHPTHLQNTYQDFDFDAAIAPVPEAIRADLARWVEDKVDALVRASSSDDDAVVVAADEGDVVDDDVDGAGGGDGDAGDGGSDASGVPKGDAASGMSD